MCSAAGSPNFRQGRMSIGPIMADFFEDIIGRHFREPGEGLGFDGSHVAHMWRTAIWPNNAL
jgi:hypothetical protein